MKAFAGLLAMTFQVACTQAEAFAPKIPALEEAPEVLFTESHSGTFREGFEFGLRNGRLISQRIEARTVGQKGCGGLEDFERGLIAVAKAVRAPESDEDLRVAGFFSGYLDAVKTSLQNVRKGCDFLVFTEGRTLGKLLSAVSCSAAGVSQTVLTTIELGTLESGWSGGLTWLVQECEETLIKETSECSAALSEAQLLSCGDSS